MAQHVLIIDDNVDDFDLCDKVLSDGGFGYSLSHAATISTALDLIKSNSITCVILDYFLPGTDCRSNIKKINALSPYLPIIILTGQGDEVIAVDLLKAGAQDYILKSKLSGDALNNVIMESVDSCRRQQKQDASSHLKTKVLIIDDNQDDRELCVRSLKKVNDTGYECIEAESWQSAEGILENIVPDCILLDYSLPGKDGLDILGILVLKYPFLPIIMMTGQGNETIAVRAIKRGAQNYFPKTQLSAELLHSAIHGAVEHGLIERKLFAKEKALHKSQIALESAKNFQTLVLQQIPDMVFVKDEKFRLVEANTAFLNAYPEEIRDSILGTTTLEAYDEAEAEAFLAQDKLAFEQGSAETEETIIFPDQKKRTLYTKKVRFEGLGGKPYILGVGRDITAYKEAMDQLLASNVELQRFAYVASHDLKEPLRMVSQFSMMLKQEFEATLEGRAKEYLHFISDGATRMQALVEDLLEYAKLDQKAETNIKVNVSELVNNVLDMLSVMIKEPTPQIIIGDLPEINSNPTRLTSLFQNLISNSLKYQTTNNQPVIEIKAHKADQFYQFEVKDNGIGFNPDYATKIFEPFKRLHAQKEYSGTGIGLAICRKIVEEFGGKIWAESMPGNGASFFFTLPDQSNH